MAIKLTRPASLKTELLGEGLRRNDLKNLVSDLVSIDEYNSKIDDSAVVVAFRVKDRAASQDLNRFIQKSYIDILDTDISPAPDIKGYYMVFVEFPLNAKISAAIQNLLADVGALCDVSDWKMRLRSVEGTRTFNEKLVARVLQDEMQSQVHEFFSASDLNDVILEGSNLTLSGAGEQISLPFVSFGAHDFIFTKHKLHEAAAAVADEGRQLAKTARLMLGGAWDVEVLGEHLVLQNCTISKILLLQKS